MKPLLPAIDLAGVLREECFARILVDRLPIKIDALAEATGSSTDRLRPTIAGLVDGGWLDLDADGRIVGAAGLSLANGPHTLTVEGQRFRTWCACDALGISAALESDSVIETACGECERPISLSFARGVPDRVDPERLWLAERGPDLRGSFCAPTVLLCGEADGSKWAAAHQGRELLLDLAEAARQGGVESAGCAERARRLS